MATGKYAKGMCRQCGLVFRLSQLRPDGETGLQVCGECWDQYHPSKLPCDASDNPTLGNPATDLDKAASTTPVGTSLATAMGWEAGTYFGST